MNILGLSGGIKIGNQDAEPLPIVRSPERESRPLADILEAAISPVAVE